MQQKGIYPFEGLGSGLSTKRENESSGAFGGNIDENAGSANPTLVRALSLILPLLWLFVILMVFERRSCWLHHVVVRWGTCIVYLKNIDIAASLQSKGKAIGMDPKDYVFQFKSEIRPHGWFSRRLWIFFYNHPFYNVKFSESYSAYYSICLCLFQFKYYFLIKIV